MVTATGYVAAFLLALPSRAIDFRGRRSIVDGVSSLAAVAAPPSPNGVRAFRELLWDTNSVKLLAELGVAASGARDWS